MAAIRGTPDSAVRMAFAASIERTPSAVSIACHGLAHGAACAGTGGAALAALERLVERKRLR